MPFDNSRLLHERFLSEIRDSAVADRGFPDQCTIERAGVGPGTLDEAGGWTPPAPTLIFTGGCRVQLDTLTQGRQIEVGDELVVLHRYRAGLPFDMGLLKANVDVLTVTCSADPAMVGRPLMVRDFILDTFLVRRGVLLEDHINRPTPEAS